MLLVHSRQGVYEESMDKGYPVFSIRSNSVKVKQEGKDAGDFGPAEDNAQGHLLIN